MTITVAAFNAALNGMDLGPISLHSADPGTGADNEISGGGYARQTATFAAAANAQRVGSEVTFSVPAGAQIKWAVIWNAAKTVAQDIVLLATPETYGNNGQFKFSHIVKLENPPAV